MKKIIILVAFSILVMSGKSIASALFEKAVNYPVVQWEDFCTNNLTAKVGAQKRGYVELDNGAQYLNAQGKYEDTKEEIVPVFGGAVCLTGPHKVKWSANINDYGAIELCTPDGLRLKSHLSCIAYANGRETVVIAKLKDSIGKLIAPNQILYEDCFDGRAVKGSLRYTYTREGFEQDVLFDQLPDAKAFNLGDNVSIQVITEFIEPPKQISFAKLANNANQDVVNLGTMQFGPGKAFVLKETVSRQNEAQLPSRKSDGIGTQHRWAKQNGRVFLVESISYNKIKSMFDGIKPQAQATSTVVQQSGEINYPEIPKQSNNNRAIELAQSNTELGPAVAIDYVILNTITNFVFAGDTTYYLSGDVTIGGLVTLEGGAVIKYDRGASLTITGGIEDRTSTYLPITFTAKDDDSIGETIKGSTGNPQNYYATTALNLHNYQSDLRNLRIFYADQAILYSGITNVPTFVDSIMYYSLQLWDSQFINCGHGIVSEGGSITLRNILMYNVRTNFQNSLNKVNIDVEHLTVNQSDKLIDGNDITLNITNSLIVNAADSSGITESNDVVAVNGNDIFQTVGAAGHYLADNSPYRNIGSTNIHTRLKDEFQLRTTFPPKVLSSIKIEKTSEFSPQVERDNDIPDLGYHYAALDYVVGECLITNANVKIKPGTAIGVFGDYGIAVSGTATIDCQGAPENMNQIVSYNLVQEQINTKWIGTSKLVAAPLNPKSEHARIYFRFTDFSLSARRGWHLYGFSQAIQPIIMKDCQFHNGYIYSARPSLQFTNCLFERVYFALDGWGIPMDSALWNNTFYGGIFEYDSTESGKWNIHNNIFDDTTIINYGKTTNVIHSCNAYLNSCAANNNRLIPASPNDVIVSRFGFLKGPLGRYYSGTNSPLINAGSLADAGDIGLYHYTIRQDQIKEANSRLDIGFHYVPMDLSTVADIVWWDDAFPPGSALHADYENWQWISKNPYPYSGKSNHISQAFSGLHQHFFEAILPSFRITPLPGDTLFCYAYIDPVNPPIELMIQWRDPSYNGWWRHRAYWGSENILLPGIYMGPLPLEGGWVRLEVPACSINAEGKELFGMAFTLYGGRVAWDCSGISRKLAPLKPFDTDEDSLPDWFEDTNGNGRFDKTDLSDFKSTDTNANGINDGDEFKTSKDPKSLNRRDKRR